MDVISRLPSLKTRNRDWHNRIIVEVRTHRCRTNLFFVDEQLLLAWSWIITFSKNPSQKRYIVVYSLTCFHYWYEDLPLQKSSHEMIVILGHKTKPSDLQQLRQKQSSKQTENQKNETISIFQDEQRSPPCELCFDTYCSRSFTSKHSEGSRLSIRKRRYDVCDSQRMCLARKQRKVRSTL